MELQCTQYLITVAMGHNVHLALLITKKLYVHAHIMVVAMARNVHAWLPFRKCDMQYLDRALGIICIETSFLECLVFFF